MQRRLRKAASSAQDQLRQLKARVDLKSREAQDSLALASAAEQKAKALEAAGLARAGPLSPLLHSPAPCSPQSLPTPAMLRALAGGSRPGSKGWLGRPDEATSQHRLSLDFGAAQGSPIAGAVRSCPGTPGDKQGRAVALEGNQAQAQLLQATLSASHLCTVTMFVDLCPMLQASPVLFGSHPLLHALSKPTNASFRFPGRPTHLPNCHKLAQALRMG